MGPASFKVWMFRKDGDIYGRAYHKVISKRCVTVKVGREVCNAPYLVSTDSDNFKDYVHHWCRQFGSFSTLRFMGLKGEASLLRVLGRCFFAYVAAKGRGIIEDGEYLDLEDEDFEGFENDSDDGFESDESDDDDVEMKDIEKIIKFSGDVRLVVVQNGRVYHIPFMVSRDCANMDQYWDDWIRELGQFFDLDANAVDGPDILFELLQECFVAFKKVMSGAAPDNLLLYLDS